VLLGSPLKKSNVIAQDEGDVWQYLKPSTFPTAISAHYSRARMAKQPFLVPDVAKGHQCNPNDSLDLQFIFFCD